MVGSIVMLGNMRRAEPLRREGTIVYEGTYHSSNIKPLEIVCNLKVLIDLTSELDLKTPKFMYLRSFKRNRQ